MKFSYNWIRELVDGLEADPKDLTHLITMKTAECEGVVPAGAHFADVCAARVIEVEPMGSSHNRKAVVDAGRLGRRTVVCGAPNCRPGIVTAYVPVGTVLDGKALQKITIGGVESEGMLASGAELGINRDSASIVEFDAEPGAPIPGCAPDHIIEIENKSINHRPDLWGHHGMAREIASILDRPLRDPVDLGRIPAGEAAFGVTIEDTALCPRYSALVFENVTVGPSPLWLQNRLQALDLNPINNIVDVTNYVMAEIAQPMHAFDADALQGGTIFIRLARAGESLVALNQEKYDLDAATLVIADADGAIAVAGVIGGLPTGITGKTRRVVLESANFQASSIRKTSGRLKLRTDASMRFEKAQDPVNTVRGLARALELLEQVSPGIRLVGGLADEGRPIRKPEPIRLPLDWLERKLGRAVDSAEVRRILTSLQFGVEESAPRVFSVSVPSWRATKDISIKDDLAEEVGRVLGYESITPVAPALPVRVPPSNPERAFHHSVRQSCAAQGFTEVYNYSFLSEEMVRRFQLDPERHVRVVNPRASDQGLMRMSLLPGIARNIESNSRHFDEFRLFEIGCEVHKQNEGLPCEVPHLAAAVWRKDGDGAAGLLECKRLAECLLPGAQVVPAESHPYEHPARAADLRWRGHVVGRLCELHPSIVEGRGAVLDLDLAAVEPLRTAESKYQPLRKFPSSSFDLSVVAGLRTLVGDLEVQLASHAGAEMVSIEFVRQYAGPPLPEGSKSVSYRLTVASPDHTLSSEEVTAIRARIIDGMRASGYELRL